ncbi:hypothetical protein M8C13_40575 [Crossiella sp. SN42]|uniref:hypothetical protein n=1 Tax=Crossiella sp. SN42 TaxID=2944808 RepID=UPI00207D562D|nr:hypothetical protein [Crossiella sp. SN42]MCO1582062.1 hypothetical protein [Crossiella sp. SN42]
MSESQDEINGRTSAMREFADQLRPPDFAAVRAAASASTGGNGGGGMDEGAAFTTAHADAVDKVTAFTAAVDQGYAAYRELAGGAAEDYRNHDLAGARQMPN